MLEILLLACQRPAASPERAELTILALNDFHGALYEAPVRGDDERRYGGLPWLAAAVDHVRAEVPNVLLLDGGDEFQGAWPVNATRGRGAVEAFTLLGVDATAVGNHELDYGRDALEAAAGSAPYPFLAANVEGLGNVRRWTVIERGGLRIGVVGLATETTPTVTRAKNVVGLSFGDPVEAVQALLPELQAADLDLTVLVGHLTGECASSSYVRNDDPCTPGDEVGRLLTELPEGTFDVMVLGHTHTVLHHRVGGTVLLEDRTLGHLLGRVDLVVGRDGVDLDASTIHDPWPIAHAPTDPGCDGGAFPTDAQDVGGTLLSPDADAIALVDRLEAEVGSLCTVVACAARPLYRARDGESELGDWLADGMRAAFPSADLAVQNSGGIRADLPAGPVRRETLQRILPFDNETLLVEMTGAQIRTMLRIGTTGAHGVLQVSGAAYTYDPADHRLCAATIGGQPLDDARTYRVVTSDFLFDGGDDLGPAFRGSTILDEGPLLREVVEARAVATRGCVGDDPPSAARIVLGDC